mgnify:CR=1 FL=1
MEGLEKEARIATRVAVSPTNKDMKLGAYRTCAYSYLIALASKNKGEDSFCVLRCDDSDPVKHKKENFVSLQNVFTNEMGMAFEATPQDEQVGLVKFIQAKKLPTNEFLSTSRATSLYQSERTLIYQHFVEKLLSNGLALKGGDGSILFDVRQYIELFGSQIVLSDLVWGKRAIDLIKLTDFGSISRKNDNSKFYLIFPNGRVLFHLAAVVDDHTWGITHIVRGVDLKPAQLYQDMLRRALGFGDVDYIYTPMLKGDTSTRYFELIKHGFPAGALISYMISSGYDDPDRLYSGLDEAANGFDLTKIHRSNSDFSIGKLESITKKLANKDSVDPKRTRSSLVRYFKILGEDQLAEEISNNIPFWNLIHNERRTLAELADYVKRTVSPNYTTENGIILARIRELCKTLVIKAENLTTDNPGNFVTELNLPKEDISFIRWILLGRMSGINPIYALQYLVEKGLLKTRVDACVNYIDSVK